MDEQTGTPQPNVLPPTPSVTPQFTPPQAKRSPLVLILFVVIIIAIFAAGGYYLGSSNLMLPQPIASPVTYTSPQPVASVDPTAGWKTYTDEVNKITFKYPQNWYANPTSGTLTQSQVFLDDHPFEIPTATEFATPIQIHFNQYADTTTNEKKYSESTIEESVKRYKTYVFGNDVKEANNLVVGGLKAVQLSGTGTGMLEGIYLKSTFIQLDNRVLVIDLYNNKNFEELYNQILSTFRFVEEKENLGMDGVSIPDQATYRNTLHGYSISFPNNWEAFVNTSGGGAAPASVNSNIVDISDTMQTSKPYPDGVITIQGFNSAPSYPSSWTKTSMNVNNATATKYETSDIESGLIGVTYLFQVNEGNYIEVLFRHGQADQSIQTFNQIINTFKLSGS